MPSKPTPRQLHCAVVINSFLYVFGGFDEAAEFRNDIFKCNLDKQSWKRISQSIKIKGRHSHSGVAYGDPTTRMYVYGGVHAGQECNDMWIYSPVENSWLELTVRPQLPARWGHTAVVYEHRMFIFGGTTNNAAVDELIEFNLVTCSWKVVEPKSDVKPPARRYHTATVWENYMYVLGGLANNNNLNDFWRFNFETHEWEKLPEGPASGRRGHVAFNFENSMAVHGGKQKSQSFGDTYFYHYGTKAWQKQYELQTEPTYFHTGVSHGNKLVLFGGLQYSTKVSKSLCSDQLSCLQIGHTTQKGVMPLLQVPSFILSRHLCSYLDEDDLLGLGATCKQLYEMCDKSPEWESIVRRMCVVDLDVKNWRQFYLSHRTKYFHLLNVRHEKFLDVYKSNPTLKVVIIGPGGIGKSNTVFRFTHNLFVEEYDPTVEDSYRKEVMIGQTKMIYDILDTAGPEEFPAMHYAFCRQGDIFILGYDTTNEATFLTDVHRYYTVLCDARKGIEETVPSVVLMGTKIDEEDRRVITTEMGKQLAVKIHAGFIETSNKANINVTELYEEVAWMHARKMYKRDNKTPTTDKKCNVM